MKPPVNRDLGIGNGEVQSFAFRFTIPKSRFTDSLP